MRYRYAPPRLITELIALTKTWGWTMADLAREIGVDETTLLGYRSGWRALSKSSIRRIARRFGDLKIVRDLTWHHFAVEDDERPGAASDDGVLSAAISPKALAQLQRYVERFADETLHGGRGLFLVSSEANVLTAASQQLSRAFAAARIQALSLRADRAVIAAQRQAALAAPLLMIERVDFLGESGSEVLHARFELARPVVLTSIAQPEELSDARLRRSCLAATRTVLLTEPQPPTQPVPASHHARA